MSPTPLQPPTSTPLNPPHATVSASAAPMGVPGDAGMGGFLRQMRQRWRESADSENPGRLKSHEDFQFYDGEGKQWPVDIRNDRMTSGRPCLEINKVKSNAQQILNEQRQSRPAIQVNPVGDGADVDTAQIIQGLVRHIEVNSGADIAYDTAFEHAVIGGFGYVRVLTEYLDEKSFDQEIVIKRVIDPFTVYFDPNAQEPDYSDAEYAFIVEDLTVDQFRARYPKAKMTGLSDFQSVGDMTREWYSVQTIRVAEYFYVETVEKTLVTLADGKTAYSDELPEDPAMPGFSGMEVAQIRGGLMLRNGQPRTRPTFKRTVKWKKMSALEVLDEADVPGRYIPIIPVLGYELIVNGRRSLSGVVRNAKDPQRQYNYMRSAVVEAVALAPKAPWMIAEGQDEGYEQEYIDANIRNRAAIHYKPTTLGDKLVPAPHRLAVEPAIAAMVAAMSQADHDLDATMSVFPSSRGQVGPEQSGKAILARTKRTEIANFNFGDNLNRGVRHVGRVVVCMIPDVYDIPMVKRIVNPDGTHKMVSINQEFETSDGVKKTYDVRVGKFDITITAGLSYDSKRREFVESVLALVQANPALMGIIGDLLVKNMDWPGAQEISERLHATLPAALQKDDQAPIPPAAQQKIVELMTQNAEILGRLQAATDTISQKRIEAESNERIQLLKSQTAILTAEIASKSAAMNQLAKLDHNAVEHMLNKRFELLKGGMSLEQESAQDAQDKAHEVGMQAADHSHEQGLAAQQQSAAQQLQDSAPQPAAPQA